MNDLDPAQATSVDDLARCLRQLRTRADRPSLRMLEARTKHVNGLLPGTRIERVPLGRTTLSEVLRGETFPRKAVLLTFVEACGINPGTDRRWEQAWDRLAEQAQDQDRKTPVGQLQRQLEELQQRLAAAEDRAAAAQAQADKAAPALPESHQDGQPTIGNAQEGTGTDDSGRGQVTIGKPRPAARKNPEKTQTSQPRHTRLLMDVLRAVYTVTTSSTTSSLKVEALACLAKALAATDPGYAERIADSIPDEASKALALAGLARALAATDPDRAKELADRAKRVADSIPDETSKAQALGRLDQRRGRARRPDGLGPLHSIPRSRVV